MVLIHEDQLRDFEYINRGTRLHIAHRSMVHGELVIMLPWDSHEINV